MPFKSDKKSVELPGNNIFSPSDLCPMTLNIELDLDMVQVDLHVKLPVCTSNGSVARVLTVGQTGTQTEGTDSITSNADAGGNKLYTMFAAMTVVFVLLQTCLPKSQVLQCVPKKRDSITKSGV